MLADALYIALVGAFIAIAVTGHGLLLTAIFPGILGKPAVSPDDAAGSAPAELGGNEQPRAPKLAA